MKFFDLYIGMYITQSVLHSLITVIIIEMSLHSWEIKDHLARFRYRLLVLSLPIFLFPVYQLINPERGSMYFRENTAIFNFNKWLAIKVWDLIPIYALFLLFLLSAALIFFFQEILPIIKERLPKSNNPVFIAPDKDINSMVDKLSKALKITPPSIQIVDEPYPMMFTAGTRSSTIVVSSGLLNKLNDDELESAFAHELVHVMRGSSIKTQIIYLLRMLMFYNPVSLIEFRRLVQDDEFICDNMTIALTGKPDALISAIKVFYSHPREGAVSKMSLIKDTIESHSHNFLLQERIAEIKERGIFYGPRFGWVKFVLTIIIILSINYMVV